MRNFWRMLLGTTAALSLAGPAAHAEEPIEGDIAFGPDGEWTQARQIWVQYHSIKGHDVEQFRGSQTVTILAPPQYKTGDLVHPYTEARK